MWYTDSGETEFDKIDQWLIKTAGKGGTIGGIHIIRERLN